MRLILALLVVAACGGRPPPGSPTTTPPPAEAGLRLWAGTAEVVVPGGPTLTLVAVDGGGARLDGATDDEEFEVQDLSGADGARFGLLLVGGNVVVLRASRFADGAPQTLEAWCLQWDARAGELVEMATFVGQRGDPLPDWIPDELHRQFAGESRE